MAVSVVVEYFCPGTVYISTVEPAITATLYNGHLLNAASGHPFLVPYGP